MTEKDQEATPESARGEAGDADELADFLQEFAEYREPEGSADASDFLDIGLPSAAGAARMATEAASPDAGQSTAETDAPAGSDIGDELEAPIGSTISLRQLDAMLERNRLIMEKQFVVFQIAKEHYGVDIGGVREILRLPEITRVPEAPEFVEGIINPRGTVIPVIDLHKRFALPERENSNETRVMVLNVDDSLVGAIVDSVTEVLSFTEDQIEPAGSLSMAISSRYVTGVAKLENRLVILLDYVQVFTEAEREELGHVAEVAAT